MPSDAKTSFTPKLRFPEFRDAAGWGPKRLGLALRFQAGFPFPSSGFNDAGKGLRLIRNRDLRSDDIVKFYSEDFDPNFVVNNGDVLVGMDGDFTPTVWEKGEALLNQRVGRILPREDNDHRFLLYLLTLCLKGIEEATARTTVKHLSHSAVEDKYEPLPSLPEQQKIAECLGTLDELMGAESQKLDALKAHKKGLLQQLFPHEGEILPRLRFSKFKTSSKWLLKTLGEIATFASGGTPSKDNPKYWNGDIPWVSASSMYDSQISKADHYVTQIAIGNGTRIAKKGSLLILVRGSMLFNRVPMGIAIKDVAFNQDVKALEVSASVNSVFLLYQLSAKESRIVINETGIGAGKIELDDLKSLEIYLPSPLEQQHIVFCLSSLDDDITAQSDKLEALKTHKKGLMQQLFPRIELP